MKLQSVQKLSLLDFPDRVACTVFTPGCNFRCPFCHNPSLVLPSRQAGEETDEGAFFDFLDSRRGRLDGVCVTGGEPLLQPGLEDFLARIKTMGFAVKIDTNGSLPDRLKGIVASGLADYVAMDIKNAPVRYGETVGVAEAPLDAVRESAAFLLSGTLPYEFRTTVVSELHTEQDMEEIGRWIHGSPKYFLQQFVDTEDLVGGGFTPCSPEKMREFLEIVRKYVPAAEIRGI